MINIYTFKHRSIFINASIALLIGILFISIPFQLVTILVQTIGALLGLSGITLLVINLVSKARHPLYLSQGIINLGIGLMMILMPKIMIDFIFLVIGIWFLVLGIYELVFAIRFSKQLGVNKHLLINAAAFVLVGLFLIINPYYIISSSLAIIGGLILLLALFMFYVGYKSKKMAKQRENNTIEAEVIKSNYENEI